MKLSRPPEAAETKSRQALYARQGHDSVSRFADTAGYPKPDDLPI
jgi:hypothetical protein